MAGGLHRHLIFSENGTAFSHYEISGKSGDALESGK